MGYWIRRLGWVMAALAAVVVLVVAATPLGRYLVRAAWEEGKILARRRSIERLVADPATSPPLRAPLELVVRARAFARDSLGLRPGDSFTTYSQLERDTLVLVLSAARRDTLAAYTWWFPVVGRLPYKGYFDVAAAQREGAAMRARGFDTYLRPASAFSTLGWFNDPLLSTTLRQDSVDLVNTVIHEITHNSLFVRGAVAFNESYASFVGARGAAAFFREGGHEEAARRAERRWDDDKLLGAFWGAVARTIDSAYAVHPGDSLARVMARDRVYERMRATLLADLAPRLSTVPRSALERMPLDNAALLARRVYASDLWLFDEVHRRLGGDLPRTLRLLEQLAGSSGDPFAAVRTWLGSSSSGHGGTGAMAVERSP